MQFGKFKGSYMFNEIYYLRKTKMIVYQIAMILCVISESVGTAALSGTSSIFAVLLSDATKNVARRLRRPTRWDFYSKSRAGSCSKQ
jgi:hypothetical protein